MKTFDHAFNVDGLRKSGPKWRAMLKSVPTLRWVAGCQHQTGMNKTSMVSACPRHRKGVNGWVRGAQPISSDKQRYKKRKHVMTYLKVKFLCCEREGTREELN
jgi:hypothetical protein